MVTKIIMCYSMILGSWQLLLLTREKIHNICLKRNLFVLSVVFFMCFHVSLYAFPVGQEWRIVTHDQKIQDTILDVRTLPTVVPNEKYNFYDENDINFIYKGGIVADIYNNDSAMIEFKLASKIAVVPAIVGYRLFYSSDKVSKIEITIGNDSAKVTNTLECKSEGGGDNLYVYSIGQYPNFIYESINAKQLPDTLHVDYIKITAKAKQGIDDFYFVLGDFKLFETKVDKRCVSHPFLRTKNINQHFAEPEDYRSTALFFPAFYYPGTINGEWFVERQLKDSSVSEKVVLSEIIKLCFENYPFYNNRMLDKSKLMSRLDSVDRICTSDDIWDYARNINPIINDFSDGHFRLILPTIKDTTLKLTQTPKAKRTEPIRVHKIRDNYYLSAIFQRGDFEDVIGLKIIEIDHLRMKDLFEKQTQMSSSEYNYEILLRRYLNKPILDSTVLRLKDSKIDTTVVIFHDKPLVVSDNFRVKHRMFKFLPDSVAYYRLNQFSEGDYIDFLSRYESIVNSKGLIIDLRGNGGGEGNIPQLLFSMFIDEPSLYVNEIDPLGNKVSIMVRPNPNFHISQSVVILIDNTTACASESFIIAMRNSKKAVIVGKSNTIGALATLNQLIFPSGIVLRTDVFGNMIMDNDWQSIESKGINPDYYIDIQKVADLYPYDDKCLQWARQYLCGIRKQISRDL